MGNTKTFETKIAGISFYEKDIQNNFAELNDGYNRTKTEIVDDYDDGIKIYKYDYVINRAELVPDPTNEHDPNAIKVMCDGVQVGFIPAKETKKVKALMGSPLYAGVTVQILGGAYKYVSVTYDIEKDRDVSDMDKDTDPIYGIVTVHTNYTQEEIAEQERIKAEQKAEQERKELERLQAEAQAIQAQEAEQKKQNSLWNKYKKRFKKYSFWRKILAIIIWLAVIDLIITGIASLFGA